MKPNVVKEENIKMFPLMIGTKLDSVRSLCVGSENYLAINSQVSENNQDASANFLTWLLFSEQGIKALNEMKMLSPYSTALQASPPIDPLDKEVVSYINKENAVIVPWVYKTFPDNQFREDLNRALVLYANNEINWSQVEAAVCQSWKREKKE